MQIPALYITIQPKGVALTDPTFDFSAGLTIDEIKNHELEVNGT